MSHYFAIVLVPAGGDVAAQVAASMSRFDEADRIDLDDEASLDRSKWWDWWRIGGRWDGTITGQSYNSAPGCRCTPDGSYTPEESECHYHSRRHETLERNAVPVIDMGECRPFTLITSEGSFSHRTHFVPDPHAEPGRWPWKYIDNEDHDRFCAVQLLAHRDHIAVGVDYHS